jgi:hypothetical protein
MPSNAANPANFNRCFMDSLPIGAVASQAQAYSDEHRRRKRAGSECAPATAAGMQAARQLLEA